MTSNFLSKKERIKNFEKIKKTIELVGYAEMSARVHIRFYHYTTLETLEAILSNKTLRLSLGIRMNDHQELSKGSSQMWYRTYISSFCYGETESIAMWTMYSIPWSKGVRISFSKSELLKWLNELSSVYLLDSKKNIESNGFDSVLTDIIYTYYSEDHSSEVIKIGDFNQVSTSEKLNKANISQTPELTGYIKNRAWDYENESRIKIVLKELVHDEKIQVNLSDDLIKSMTVTFSPWINKDLVDNFKFRFPNIKTEDSKFNKLVNIRTECSICSGDFAINARRWGG